MSQENKVLVRRFFELLGHNQRVPEELLGPGFTYHVAGSPPKDLSATQQRMAMFGAASSDARHVEEDMVAEGDKVAFRTRLEMTHSGEFMGIAATYRQISIVEMGIMRIEDGKIAEMWGLLDTMELMQQIGAMPPASLPPAAG